MSLSSWNYRGGGKEGGGEREERKTDCTGDSLTMPGIREASRVYYQEERVTGGERHRERERRQRSQTRSHRATLIESGVYILRSSREVQWGRGAGRV